LTTLNDTMKYFHFTSANIAVKGLLTGLVYGFLVFLSNLFIFPVSHSPVIWSANAFPVAVLLFNRKAQWPAILFFCLAGLLVSGLSNNFYNVTPHLIVYLINLLEIYFLATIIRKATVAIPTRKKLKSIITAELWATALAVMLFSILSVLVFSTTGENINFISMIARIFTSAYLGQAMLLPALLYWIVLGRPSIKGISEGRIVESLLMWLILVISIAVTMASLKSGIPVYHVFPYLTFPILIWSAIRFDIRLTIICSIITSLFTKYIASLGYISFGSADLSSSQQIILMNVGLIALNISVLILAIIVTDQKQIKQDLTRREEWFQIAIDHMPGGLYLLSQKRRFIILSTGLREQIGLPPEICHLGAHIEPVLKFRAERGDFGPGDPDDLVRERLDKLEETETTQGHNSLPNGQEYEYFQNHTKNGEIIIIYHDITDRIKAERDSLRALAEAQHANKAKTDFLANMSHELRTPLNAIIGFSEMMTQDGFVESSADKVREYCTDINMSGRHLLQIINDILDLSKIEAGMADVVLEPIYLEDSIQECVKFIELRAADAEITIFNEVRDTPARILVDKRMFKQVIVNILSNSVKFTPQGGNIHISFALTKKGETTIIITDTGIGIAEADIATVMEPFHQADSSLSRNFEGTGLGLPLVKSLMEIHGGRIDLKSRTGVGTTVSLTFPPHSSIPAE